MKHLTDEQCLEMMEGRASAEAQAHVSSCAECASKIGAWRQSARLLEQLQWPAPIPRRTPVAPRVSKWAIAASAAMLIGFAFGRSTTSADIAAVKAQIHEEVVAQVNREQSARDRAVIRAMQELRDQQTANYLLLRNDLETLASTAEARIQRIASTTDQPQ